MTLHTPTTAEAVAELVVDALAETTPIEIIGNGSKRGLGRPVETAEVVSLKAISGIRLYEPEELVMTIGAGTTLDEIERALNEARQQLQFEPPDWRRLYGTMDEAQTIAGILAANLSGPRRLQAGAARDHLLGFSAVNGRGEIFKSGGRVVKNVTGYDLSKLMAGSYGTLAILTEVTLKVMPQPEDTATLLLLGLNAKAGTACLTKALASSLDVSGAAWLPGALAAPLGCSAGESVTVLRLEGLAASVADRLATLEGMVAPGVETRRLGREESRRIWRDLADVAPLVEPHRHPVWRVSVPPSRGCEVLAAFPDGTGYLDWAGGQVWLSLPPSANAGAERLRALTHTLGGHATLVRATAEIRRTVPVFEPQPSGLAGLSARVKDSFDPRRLFNPGRLQAGL
jgi:glycolate oxidase FAD binding subunit